MPIWTNEEVWQRTRWHGLEKLGRTNNQSSDRWTTLIYRWATVASLPPKTPPPSICLKTVCSSSSQVFEYKLYSKDNRKQPKCFRWFFSRCRLLSVTVMPKGRQASRSEPARDRGRKRGRGSLMEQMIGLRFKKRVTEKTPQGERHD